MDNHNRVKINVNSATQRVPLAPNEPSQSTQPRPTRPTDPTQTSKKSKHPKKPLTKKRKISIAALVVGIVVLLGGIGFLAYRIFSDTSASDAEYLVKIGTWQREDAPDVIWQFTDIGHGTLTTNDHVNDYDFAWALEDDQIKIDTDWLITKNDEYTYHIDQSQNQLTIEGADETLTFVPATKDNNESKLDTETNNTIEESVEDTVEE